MLQMVHASRLPTVGICMGDIGAPTRILGGRCGAPFTYATFNDDRVLAPGQIGWRQMREMYRYDSITAATRIYGVVADPVGHSLSPVVHNAALAAAGIVIAPDDIVIQPFSIEGGRQGLRVIAARGERPTALVCTTDLMAAGALAEAHALGIAVPDALSITGFDDIDIASAISPPLTTIHAPIREMGERVGERMLVRLKGGAPDPSLTIPTHLVRRQSAGVVAKK
jgi:hypothetical protein